jgi:hypothetical protein
MSSKYVLSLKESFNFISSEINLLKIVITRHGHMPVIQAIQEAQVEQPYSKANLGKVSLRPYLKNKLKIKGLGTRLKW